MLSSWLKSPLPAACNAAPNSGHDWVEYKASAMPYSTWVEPTWRPCTVVGCWRAPLIRARTAASMLARPPAGVHPQLPVLAAHQSKKSASSMSTATDWVSTSCTASSEGSMAPSSTMARMWVGNRPA